MKLKNDFILPVVILAMLLGGCSEGADPQKSALTERPKSTAHDPYYDYLNRDVRDDVFYFVLPDRFYNANPDNDHGSKDIEVSKGGFDTTSKWAFHGGDMQGLEAKLEYLKNMGITAIWMTPILRNQAVQWSGFAHHGYWILDFTQIDPHFGSNEDLKSLIEAAHKQGIKIFFDIITNHTADVIRYQECHNPDGSFKDKKTCAYKSLDQVASGDKYTPFIPLGMENLKTPAWLNDPKYYNNQGDSIWKGESAVNGDFVGLDDLNTLHPEVVSGFIDIYKNIITEFKPDGFRIDTVKHVDMSFWEEFGPAIVEHAKGLGLPQFHIFGEVYDGDPVVLSSFTTQGKLPSVLDFGFQGASTKVFYRNESPEAFKELFNNDDYYNDADSQADILMNFLGNHDMGRAGYFIVDGMGEISDQERLQRSILSHAFMFFSRGIPVVYYGDEQGFTGDGGDVDARENMFPSRVEVYNDNPLIGTQATTADDNFDQNHPIYLALKKLSKIRGEHKALRHGISVNRHFDGNKKMFAISRLDLDERREYLVVVNADTKESSLTLKTTAEEYQLVDGEQNFSINEGNISVTLPGLSYSVLKASTTLPFPKDINFTLSAAEKEQGLLRFTYAVGVEESQEVLPVYEVITEIKTSSDEWVLAAKDYTFPYSAIVHQSQLGDANEIRVSVSNLAGESRSQIFPIAP